MNKKGVSEWKLPFFSDHLLQKYPEQGIFKLFEKA